MTESAAPASSPAASVAGGGPVARPVDTSGVRTGRIPVADIAPQVDAGRFPARAVVGERVRVTATVFREGHDAVGGSVALSSPTGQTTRTHMRPDGEQPDRWEATVVVDAQGLWTWTIEGWSDPYGTWRHDAGIKIPLEQDVELVCAEGTLLLERYAAAVAGLGLDDHQRLADAVAALRDTTLPAPERVAAALAGPVAQLLTEHPLRDLVSPTEVQRLWVDRERALYGAWYEFFPRSEGADVSVTPPVHGTFATAAQRLPAIAAMGFDVVYVPPVHPIGHSYRKGPNNTLTPGEYDVGSPWAIGSAAGGHDAVHPDLGTLEDFDAFVRAVRDNGMELAIDLALQASPDHPWAREHPEWFSVRADGSIAYAENPPKKYQDIYPVNFDRDPEGIYAEVLRIVLFWVSHDVKIFRVDNPHTKPVQFWEWLIAEVKSRHPDVLFLAEAFTRPAMMHTLGKVGFTQSYTYFTWRTAKWELELYAGDLAGSVSDYMRPNFFTNTPDILHASLQYGGPPMFKIRAVLASMLSPTYGIYSGYELYEHTALRAGSEEYLDTEKFQLRPRDYAGAEAAGQSLAPYLTRLNQVRREHPALHRLRNLRFHHVDNDAVMCFSKAEERSDGTQDIVLVVLSLDSHNVREAITTLDMPALGLDWQDRFTVTDQITGAVYDWGQHNYVRLDPWVEPAHLFAVTTSTVTPPIDQGDPA